MKFNKVTANDYINDLCKKHKIKIQAKRSVSSCGRAWRKTKIIKIPHPTSIDRFAVCLHEVYHIIGKKESKAFIEEFNADLYALNIITELGYDTADWIKRMKWHSLSRLAMAHNRSLNHANIPQEIKEFFAEVDFSKWLGKKVYVGHAYFITPDPANIQLTVAMNRGDVEMLLNRQGFMLEKSQYDDSTYGKWLVGGNGYYSKEFDNLSEIVDYYKLAI